MSKEYKVEDIITAIQNKKPVDVEKAFNGVLSDKLQSSLDDKKQALAKSVFAGSEESSEEDDDSEIEEAEGAQFKSSEKTSKLDRKKKKKKREKWLKTSCGKKYKRNQEKRNKKIEKGTLRPNKQRSKKQKNIAKAYKNER